jgi:alpha-tubulin suppressor-like RCC1 family protein
MKKKHKWIERLIYLFLGSTDFRISIPTLIHFPSKVKIIEISCGARHSVALTNTQRVFAWGDNTYGKNATYHHRHFCFSVSFSSECQSFLISCIGQCGICNKEDNITRITKPTLIPSINHCRQVACGHFHTLFLSRDRTFFFSAFILFLLSF